MTSPTGLLLALQRATSISTRRLLVGVSDEVETRATSPYRGDAPLKALDE